MLTMSVNVLSDSQESVLLDPALMDHLQNDLQRDNIGIDFLSNAILEEPEKKYDLNAFVRPHEQYPQEIQNPIPARDEFAGRFDFQLLLNQQGPAKNWIYSQPLSKVFINMDEVLPLRFKWEPAIAGLFLRTTMVYVLESHRSDPVIRCHNHMAMPSRANIGVDLSGIRHVVRCVDRNSTYEQNHDGHLSIRTPLGRPEVGAMYVPVHFKFLCKNSCTSGMNRRATEMIFTLENEQQNVLGRRRLLVRICSCPKRDKEKEELEASGLTRLPGKKKKGEKVDASQAPLGKRLCLPNEDFTPVQLNLEILGREDALAVKKYAYDIMAGRAVRTGQLELYKPYLNKILS